MKDENLEAKLIGDIGDCRHALAVATDAVNANESALADIRVVIGELEKKIPKTTFNDLIKAQCADTARRRAGI
jgi:hypothetical protein